jgi:DNA-binding NarL/FixJ family response regulator
MTTATREPPVRVVVIDDTVDLRDLLRYALSRGGFDVVGEASNGRAGIDIVRDERPDVVLLDLAMPIMGGAEALPHIRQLVPDAQIITFSGFDEARCEQMLVDGADGHLVKGTRLKDIVAYVVERVGNGSSGSE